MVREALIEQKNELEKQIEELNNSKELYEVKLKKLSNLNNKKKSIENQILQLEKFDQY